MDKYEKMNENKLELPPNKIQQWKNEDDNSKKIYQLIENSKFVNIYSSSLKIFYSDQSFIENCRRIVKEYKNGSHKGIRWITSIENTNDLGVIKSFINKGVKIRHVPNEIPFSFILTNQSLISLIANYQMEKIDIENLYSTDDFMVRNHHRLIFEKLWDKGIDVRVRIKNIQDDDLVKIKIVNDVKDSIKIITDLFLTVKQEVLIITPSINGFFRMELAGSFHSLNDMAIKGINIRILSANDVENQHEVDRIRSKYKYIKFGNLQIDLPAFNRIIVLDRKNTIIWELRDDSQINYTDALGTAIFLDGNSTAQSYASIFYGLWKQAEIFQELKKKNEQLEFQDKMQKEFLDLIAHELRTPLQSILGLTEIAKKKVTDINQIHLLNIANRNGKKLQMLTENILEVIKIDNELFTLNKEYFNLNNLIKNIIQCIINDLDDHKKINFEFKSHDKEWILFADKDRIRNVIYSLIDNSTKFIIKEGNIIITISEKSIHSKKIVVVNIKDSGETLNPKVLSKLFTKFGSGSHYGIGLGLFLSKNIVEAHGGRIWARNNDDGNGTTFSFGIPLK